MKSTIESEDADGIAMCTGCGLEKCVPGFEYCSGCTREAFELYKQSQQKPKPQKPRKNVRLITGIEKAMSSSLSTEEITFLSELLPEEIRGDGKEMLEVIRGYKMSANPKNKSRKKEEIVTKLIHLLYGYKSPAIIITENGWLGPLMLKHQIERYSQELEALHPQNVNYLSNGLQMIQKLLQHNSVKEVKRTSNNAESVVCMKVDKEYLKMTKNRSLNLSGEEEDENLSGEEEDENMSGEEEDENLSGGEYCESEVEEESEKDVSLSLGEGGDKEEENSKDESRDAHGPGVNSSRRNNGETSSQHSNSGGGKKYSSGSSGSQESPGGVPSAGPRMGAAFHHLATSHSQPQDATMEEAAYGATFQPYHQTPRASMESLLGKDYAAPKRGSQGRVEDYSTGRGGGPVVASSRGPVYSPRVPAKDPAAHAIVRVEPPPPAHEFSTETNDFPTLPGTSTIANAAPRKQVEVVDPGATPWEFRPRDFLEKQPETILVLSETDKGLYEDNSSLSRFMTPRISQRYVADVTKRSGLVSTPQNFISQKGLRVHLPANRKATDTIEPSSSNWIKSPPRTSSPKLNLNKENATEEVRALPNGSPSSDFISQDIGHQILSNPIAPEVAFKIAIPPNSHYQGDGGLLVKGSSFVQNFSNSKTDSEGSAAPPPHVSNVKSGILNMGGSSVMVPGATFGCLTGVEKINRQQAESGCKRGLSLDSEDVSQNLFTFTGDVEPNGDAPGTIAIEDGNYIETPGEFGDKEGDSSEMDSNDTEVKPFKFLKTVSSKSKVKQTLTKVAKSHKGNKNGVRGGRTNIRGRGGKGGGGRGLRGPIGEFPKLGCRRDDAQGPPSVLASQAKNTFDIKPRSKESPSPSYQGSRFKSAIGNSPGVVKSAFPSMLDSPVEVVSQEVIIPDNMVDRCSQSPKLNDGVAQIPRLEAELGCKMNNEAVTGAPEAINENGGKGAGTSEMGINDTNTEKQLIILGPKVKATARKKGGVRSAGPPGGSGKGSLKVGYGQGNTQEPSSVSPSKKSKGSTSPLRLYEIDSDPERRKFLDHLFDFMEKRSTSIVRCPILGQIPVDLFRLYQNIKGRGGFTQCNKSWRNIAAEVGISHSTNVAYSLKKIYEKNLLPFENTSPFSLNLSALSSKESQVNVMETVSLGTQGQANGPLIQFVGDTSIDINKILNLSQKV